MIFVVELFLKERQAKIRAWERARDEWIAADTSQYSYRTKSDYERIHPYPLVRWNNVMPYVGIVLLTLVVIGSVVSVIIGHDSTPQQKKAQTTSDCQTYVKKGDKIGVGYGDYSGSKGVVLQQRKDCSVDITLTDSTNTFDKCKKADSDYTCSNTMENGSTLHINKSDNVIPL